MGEELCELSEYFTTPFQLKDWAVAESSEYLTSESLTIQPLAAPNFARATMPLGNVIKTLDRFALTAASIHKTRITARRDRLRSFARSTGVEILVRWKPKRQENQKS
jgi:hypothetical protein